MWDTPGGELMLDYGAYSGPHTPGHGDSNEKRCTTTIAADTVVIATFQRAGKGYMIHAWWPHTPPMKLGARELPTSLMIIGTARDEAGREELRTSIFSLRMRRQD